MTKQKSGSPVDEVDLKGIVIFADTDRLASAALSILTNQKLRLKLQRRAVMYMWSDITRASLVKPTKGLVANEILSGLSLVANAIVDLRGLNDIYYRNLLML